MKQLQSLLNQLEACMQDEIRSQERTLELLDAQERAIRSDRPEDLESSTRSLERELLEGVSRSERRARVLRGLEAAWSVPASAMTLSSIAERAAVTHAESGERLVQLRGELRERAARVVKQNRRVGALMLMHRRLVQDVIGVLFEGSQATPLQSPGTLVNAEA